MIRAAALGMCIACSVNAVALAGDKCRRIAPRFAQERCYAQQPGMNTGLDGERRRTQAVLYLRIGEAVAASYLASERCDEMKFNTTLAMSQLKSFGYTNPEELKPFIDDVEARFEADNQLACRVAWAMHGPTAQNGFRFIYLAGPKYSDPQQTPPSGFIDAFERGRSANR